MAKMTKAEAKRYACRIQARSIQQDFDNGSGWLTRDNTVDGADEMRIREAAEDLMMELTRRGGDEGED